MSISVLTMMRPIMKPICWKLPSGASGLYFADTSRYSCISGRGSSSRLSSALTLSLLAHALPSAAATELSFNGVDEPQMTLSMRPSSSAAFRIFRPSGGV